MALFFVMENDASQICVDGLFLTDLASITNAATVGLEPATFDHNHFNVKSFDFQC